MGGFLSKRSKPDRMEMSMCFGTELTRNGQPDNINCYQIKGKKNMVRKQEKRTAIQGCKQKGCVTLQATAERPLSIL